MCDCGFVVVVVMLVMVVVVVAVVVVVVVICRFVRLRRAAHIRSTQAVS